MLHVRCVIIGAGVVGLALSRRLRHLRPLVLESGKSIGQGVSSRSSEVVHAGLYHPRHMLKSKLCWAGSRMLFDHCQQYNVGCRRVGKLIVATQAEEVPLLQDLYAHAKGNEVEGISWLGSPAEIHALEPHIHAMKALWSPNTGIVDSHGLMASLLALAEASGDGALLHCESSVVRGRILREGGVELEVRERQESIRLRADVVVNCAGLHATSVARSIAGLEDIPETFFRKGRYFELRGKPPPELFRHLVYPLPVPGGLGTHVTMDLEGRIRFGPDVLYVSSDVDDVDFDFASSAAEEGVLREQFARSIRNYWPACDAEMLKPGYVGVRPTLLPAGESGIRDFDVRRHNHAPVVGLYGIESPGLTSALALADYVATQHKELFQ